jgi:hypothetical protein
MLKKIGGRPINTVSLFFLNGKKCEGTHELINMDHIITKRGIPMAGGKIHGMQP